MDRAQALDLIHSWTTNPNLIKHMLAVEAQLRALAHHFNQDEDLWGLAGLLHDADYQLFANQPEKHPSKIVEELQSKNVDSRIIQAIRSHAWGWQPGAPEPRSQLDWALYTSDELSGLIIACALVRPDKKLSSLTLDSILKKWHTQSFAAGVHRDHILLCETKLGIKLNDYITICLNALQDISSDLEL